jgi:hypothetical protein
LGRSVPIKAVFELKYEAITEASKHWEISKNITVKEVSVASIGA